jgi:hypothetical protein
VPIVLPTHSLVHHSTCSRIEAWPIRTPSRVVFSAAVPGSERNKSSSGAWGKGRSAQCDIAMQHTQTACLGDRFVAACGDSPRTYIRIMRIREFTDGAVSAEWNDPVSVEYGVQVGRNSSEKP